MHEIGALRAGRHLLPVDEEAIPVVGGDVDDEALGRCRELEHATKVEHAVPCAGCVPVPDPGSRERSPEDPGRLELGFAPARTAGQNDDAEGDEGRSSRPHRILLNRLPTA
jgi:hypothetical protein